MMQVYSIQTEYNVADLDDGYNNIINLLTYQFSMDLKQREGERF